MSIRERNVLGVDGWVKEDIGVSKVVSIDGWVDR